MDDSGRMPWPVEWSAVWVGALTALAVGLIIGLIGFAVGAHEVSKAATWKNVRMFTLIFNVAGAFFAFAAAGWVAARLADLRRAETAIIHGTALSNLTGVLVGLMGAVIGAWMASGEPMSLTYYRRRERRPMEDTRPRRVA